MCCVICAVCCELCAVCKYSMFCQDWTWSGEGSSAEFLPTGEVCSVHCSEGTVCIMQCELSNVKQQSVPKMCCLPGSSLWEPGPAAPPGSPSWHWIPLFPCALAISTHQFLVIGGSGVNQVQGPKPLLNSNCLPPPPKFLQYTTK